MKEFLLGLGRACLGLLVLVIWLGIMIFAGLFMPWGDEHVELCKTPDQRCFDAFSNGQVPWEYCLQDDAPDCGGPH